MATLRPSTVILAALLVVLLMVPATAQPIGITNGFPYTINPSDTTSSPYLPTQPSQQAGIHGFLKRDQEGNFRFDDGNPARFYGVTLQWTACFPDSTSAIATAARLRKLGVNLVRFQYMDNSYDWWQQATFLDAATGFRTLHPQQIRRLDWFIAQLKRNGIYSYLTLQSARVARTDDGIGATAADSVIWLGTYLNYLYPQMRTVNKEIARQLLDHVNPFTGTAYKSEPAIALIEIMGQGSLISRYRQGQTEYRPGGYGFSWQHSSRLDTLFTEFLRRKYGTKQALASAWRNAAPHGGFPNLIQEGSFEGDFERSWIIDSYDGVSVSKILTQGDSVPDGSLALTLRVRNGSGNVYAAYMIQNVRLEFNTLYRLSFKAKCSNPGGRKVIVGGYQEGGLGAGLFKDLEIAPYWREQDAYFLVPVKSSDPFSIVLWYGDVEGDLQIDDIQIRAVETSGLQAREAQENALVGRIPWGNDLNALLSSGRIEDQSEFYMGLEAGYLTDLHRFVSDTIKAQQPVSGASHYWASGYMEAAIQKQFDYSTTSAGWDWISGEGDAWQIRNTSQLRIDWGGAIYEMTMRAHREQPYIGTFMQPYPNRYQAESMLMLPAYSLLQDWDGLILDTYAEQNTPGPEKFIDTGAYYTIEKNPLVVSLMPAVAHLFRNGFLKPARTAIPLRHSTAQARLLPRMEGAWGLYAVPGGINGRTMLINRVVIDSTDAEYFTQSDDISFPSQIEGEVASDTREILWEYNRGTLSLDAPRAQGATGALARAGGFTLRNISIALLSANETATLLWVPLDTAQPLGTAGRSLLVLVSRTEPTGWHWRDSTHADLWGAGPMLFDPLRVRLAFNVNDTINRISITPLDSSGMPAGETVVLRKDGPLTTTIDQGRTPALWYSVELATDPSLSTEYRRERETLTAWPSITADRTYITVTLKQPLQHARLELFNPLGRRVRMIHEGAMEAGEHTVRLEASDLPSGTYLIRLVSAETGGLTTRVIVAH